MGFLKTLGHFSWNPGGIFDGKKNESGGGDYMRSQIEIAPFFEDPYVGKTQDKLFNFGSELLAGTPNEYFAPIGEVGGDIFEQVLAKVVRDTTGATESSAIKRGVGRGGSVSSAIGKNVADVSSSMRWSDFTRAMEGRKGFLNTGNNMISGVRSSALTNQSQKNTYELNRARTQAGIDAQAFEQGNYVAGVEDGATSEMFGMIENLIDQFSSIGNPGTSQRYLTQEQLQEQNTKPLGSASGSGMDWTKLLMDVAKTYAMTQGF